MDAMQSILDQLDKLNNQAIEMDVTLLDKKIDIMLPELGFSPEDNDRLVASYSGGWQMRMCLGKILLQVRGRRSASAVGTVFLTFDCIARGAAAAADGRCACAWARFCCRCGAPLAGIFVHARRVCRVARVMCCCADAHVPGDDMAAGAGQRKPAVAT